LAHRDVPEGTDLSTSGKIVSPVDRHARLCRRTTAPATARPLRHLAGGRRGGITTSSCQPDTSPVIDNSATVDSAAPLVDTAIVNIHRGSADDVPRGQEMTRDRPVEGRRRRRLHDGARASTNAQVMRAPSLRGATSTRLIVQSTPRTRIGGEGVMNEGEFAARLGLFGIPKHRSLSHADATCGSRR